MYKATQACFSSRMEHMPNSPRACVSAHKCSPSSSASWRIMKEKELHRISAMCPAADAGNRNGVMRSSPPLLPPPPLDLRRGVLLARRSSCRSTPTQLQHPGTSRSATMRDVQWVLAEQDSHQEHRWGGGQGAGQDAAMTNRVRRRTCRSRASRSDDSAWSIVLYDLLANALRLAFMSSGLPSDAKAMSAQSSHARPLRRSARHGMDVGTIHRRHDWRDWHAQIPLTAQHSTRLRFHCPMAPRAAVLAS